jgi:sulfate adenylyltransferase large subunit
MYGAARAVRSPGTEPFLVHGEEKELLRFTTAGSVDDGKSTLIGRLLYDSKGVYDDHVAAIRRTSATGTNVLDFALLTDGLRAEREQGITIDVAYRYFSTPKRKFIIADTPGHEQYTRNMATGASTANLAIILIDARHGVLQQSRRHAFLASLLGIPHLVVAINKMDLVGFDQCIFERIRDEFSAFAASLQVTDVRFIPISALHGDNVVNKSARMPWYQGESLLYYLENVHIASDRNLTEVRFPVQCVIRPNLDFRGYAGQVASGILKPGDRVMVLPSGKTTRIKKIHTYDGDLARAFPPMSVTLCLEDDVDVSRGDMLVHPEHLPQVSRRMDARLVWMNEAPLEIGREYLIKHTTQFVRARVMVVRYVVNINTLERQPASELRLNEIGSVVIECNNPLFFDAYRRNRATGSFVVIDTLTNETVGAGMITARPAVEVQGNNSALETVRAGRSRVAPAERASRFGHGGGTVWLIADEELACSLERRLFDLGCAVHTVTGGNDAAAVAGVARVAVAAGLLTICRLDASSEAQIATAKSTIGGGAFVCFNSADLPADSVEAISVMCAALRAAGFLKPDTTGSGWGKP